MSIKTLSIIGGGNLGRSIAEGIVEKSLFKPNEILITRRNKEKLADLSSRGYNVSESNAEACTFSDIVMLCVQPKQLPTVIEEIKDSLTSDHVLISVLAGTLMEEIRTLLDKSCHIVRAMPNTAISIGESITCICADESTPREVIASVESVFGALGQTLVIEEKLMKAATVLGASGIAFCMKYIRASMQGGVQMGFEAEEALEIVLQTIKGASQMVMTNHSHPETEIDKVSTPQGCTITGLNEMEHRGFSSALVKGLLASYDKLVNIKK